MVQSMSRAGHCIDNGAVEGFWGIIKSEMYQMYEIQMRPLSDMPSKTISDFTVMSVHRADMIVTPSEVRNASLTSEHPLSYLIAKNKRIEKYKSKWYA
mgnify:CR=1 FL=1